MTEAQILARQLDKSRELSRWYLSFLKDADVSKTFDFNGKIFNSIIWEVGHMATTQSYMGLYMTYGPYQRAEWGAQFGLGSDNLAKANYPDYKEVWAFFKSVHAGCVEHIAGLSDADLDQPTKKPFGLMGVETVRDVVIHMIRHEGVHTGHLGWLCKLHGVKTI